MCYALICLHSYTDRDYERTLDLEIAPKDRSAAKYSGIRAIPYPSGSHGEGEPSMAVSTHEAPESRCDAETF